MATASQHLFRLTQAAAETADRDHTRHAVLGEGALAAMPAWLAEHHPGAVDLIVADAHTFAAAGEALQGHLEAAGRTWRTLILEPRPVDDHLVCEDGVIESLAAFLDTFERFNPIAVGAGTISDTVKMASFRLGRGYQAVPTAASMNGYTSAIAAVLSRGVKRTLPCHQPEAVFAELGVLQAAPAHLNQAGFGDLLSKPYSHADWLLSHLVRGGHYSPEAAELLDDAFTELLERAAGVRTSDAAALRLLMETLLVSGFSMAIAGTSAPASGGEHLASHYWDMEQHCRDLPLRGLHGTQVGVGTRLVAMLFERLVALEPEAIDPQAAAARRPDPSWIDDIASVHPGLTPPVVDEVREQLAAKQRHGAELAAELADVRARWAEIRAALRSSLMPADRVTAALRAAGCTDRASGLGVNMAHLVRTLRVCRQIRSRYVGLDLMDDLGALDGWAADVAQASETT